MRLRDLLLHARPHARQLLLASLLMLLESACALAIPALAARFADEVLDLSADFHLLLFLLLVVVAAQAVLRFLNNLVSGKLALQVSTELRTRLYDHVQALPISFFNARRQGSVLALLTHEAELLSGFLSGTLLGTPAALVTAAGAVVFMLLLDPAFGVLVALGVPLFFLVLRFAARGIRPLSQALQREHASLVAMLDENLRLMPVIKSFTREVDMSARHAGQSGRLLELGLRQNAIYAFLEPCMHFLGAAAVLGLVWLGAGRMLAADMSPGELLGFLMYAVLLTRPVSTLATLYGQVQTARGALERLQGVMQQPGERGGRLHPPQRAAGRIRFENVSFSYPGGRPVLRQLDLLVEPGETVAITGANGSGKSTLLHLLQRLRVPDSGRICLDEHDVAELDLAWLRQQMAVVGQQVLLFNGSIRANIRFARLEATDEAVEAAARMAQLHDFVLGLEQGYDTPIGDRGLRLSGGMQQRLALARAFLKDAPLLLLDEPSAMFDPTGERDLVRACATAAVPRTILLVTHRPQLLELADRILEMRDGHLHERVTIPNSAGRSG